MLVLVLVILTLLLITRSKWHGDIFRVIGQRYRQHFSKMHFGRGIGARRHGQGGGHLSPSGNVVKCFCALVVTAKPSVAELFMHYFHNLSSASGFCPQMPTRIHPWTPLGDFHSQAPNLPTPGKNPAGAHGQRYTDLWFSIKNHLVVKSIGKCHDASKCTNFAL